MKSAVFTILARCRLYDNRRYRLYFCGLTAPPRIAPHSMRYTIPVMHSSDSSADEDGTKHETLTHRVAQLVRSSV